MNKLNKVKIFDKYWFYYLPDDKYIGQRVALEKYEPYETKLVLRQVKAGNIVVDIGANIGYYTLLLADKVGPRGRVYAFEPDSKNFEILKKNVKENGFKNVILVKAAVSSQKGIKELYKSSENYGDHKMFGEEKKRVSEEVKTIVLDDFLKKREKKIDFLKIDTQGWEPLVIEGSKKIIKENKPTIFFEYSPSSYREAKVDGDKMMKFIKSIYGNIFWIDEWFFIYKVLKKNKIDGICKNNKTRYSDLWVKEKVTLNDRIGQFKNIEVRKVIKKILNL